jgi:DNA-binding TFAR19-related protein (PDSD5 family)
MVKMSPKELLYVEDALEHEKLCMAQTNTASQHLTDQELKQFVSQLANKHQQLFSQFFGLL